MNRVAILFMTPQCNMHCSFCGAEAGFDAMTEPQALDLLSRLQHEGVDSVVLGGGEPFCWDGNLFRIARHARQLGLLVQVGTNGTLAPGEPAALHEFDRWILPLESLDSDIHDTLRDYEGGHLNRVIRLLERLKHAQVEATVSSLVTRQNVDRLLEVGAFLSWYKSSGGLLHAWHLYRFLPVGRGGRLNAGQFGTSGRVFASMGALLKQRYPDLRIYLRPDMYHSKTVSFHWVSGGEFKSFEQQGALNTTFQSNIVDSMETRT